MAEFFPDRNGIALFLNAGDPPLPVLADLVAMLDESGVDCLELAVPFPNSVTDGPVIRDSASRALANGVGLAETLEFIAAVRPKLRRLRIALLADWSYSVKGRPLPDVLTDIAESGTDGVLLHALPPRLRTGYYVGAGEARLPIVTTCYHGVSSRAVMTDAAVHATAYLYLVANYGRSGSKPASGYAELAGSVTTLRANTTAPIAVGFGIRTRADVEAVSACGADAVIVGSAGVSRVEHALAGGLDVVADFHDFVRSLQPANYLRTGG